MARSTRAGGIRALCGALLTLAAASSAPLATAATLSSAQLIADVHSIGSITLWNKAGQRIAGGSLSVPLNSELAKATASGPAPVGYRDGVELNMWTPNDGADPSQWNGCPLRGGSADAISREQQDKPLSTSNISNWTLDRDIGLCGGPSTGGYQNRYELRLVGIRQGPTFSPSYYTSTIEVDPAAGTWEVVAASATSRSSTGFPGPAVGGAAGAGGVVVALGSLFWWRRRSSHMRHNPESVPNSAPSIR